MLITCNGCNCKIRVPDTAAGKRVKCPKCALVLKVPAEEKRPETGSTEPDESTDVTASAPPLSAKPPPVSKQPASSSSRDYDDDEDDEPAPRRRDDDDDDEFDDDLDVRNRRRRSSTNSMATTSMVMGVISVTMSTVGCLCCGMIGATIAAICGIMAISFGMMGNTPGNEGMAKTGIICGAVGLVCSLIGLVLGFIWLGVNLGMMN
jgi:hypothetical protein